MRNPTIPTLIAGTALGIALVLGACSDPASDGPEALTAPDAPAAAVVAASVTPPDASGDWVWSHHTIFVIPTPVAAMIVPETVHEHLSGPVTQIKCDVSGVMHLLQDGVEFSGTSTQVSDCALKTGPRFAMPFVYQSPFEVSNGAITGRSFTFNVGAGCLNRGTFRVTDGVATRWRASGACEIPLPIQPAVANTVAWIAERQ